jgi:hypothetical protein
MSTERETYTDHQQDFCERSVQAFGAPTFAGASTLAGVIKMQTEEDRRYADLEKPLEDVREMAQVVAQMAALVESGEVAWDPCLFAIYHLAELANTLHAQYHGDEPAAA